MCEENPQRLSISPAGIVLETLGAGGMSGKNKRGRTGARAVENFLNDGDSGRAKKERGPEEARPGEMWGFL